MPGKVHYETAERIATITLDNPTALNAAEKNGFSTPMRRAEMRSYDNLSLSVVMPGSVSQPGSRRTSCP